MANKGNSYQSGQRSRVRFMLVDFDGTSNDLQQLAQTFANAVKSSTPSGAGLPGRTPNGTPLLTAEKAQENVSKGLFDEIETEQPVYEEAEVIPIPEKPPNGGKRKKLRTPQVISNLDFNGTSKPLKEYFEEQAPKNDAKRYLAITQWLKEQSGIAEVGADHVYTCYRFLAMNVPEDVLGVFRGLKRQGSVEKGSKAGTFKITHIGVNQLSSSKNKE